jgi:hypothetical protein
MKSKCILFTLFCWPLFQLQATHISGMDLYYRYIGDSTGIAHHYEFYIDFFREIAGIAAPQNISLTGTSSCSPNFTINLQRDPTKAQGQLNPTLNECVDAGPASGTKVNSIYYYRGDVELPGLCADYQFSYSCGACRNAANNTPSNQNFMIVVQLNNTLGQNSSPKFSSLFRGPLCAGRPIQFFQNAFETDGDSLHFGLITPLAGMLTNQQPINWYPGYSAQQPLMTIPQQSLVFDATNGQMNFTLNPAGLGDYAMAIQVTEYRFNSNSNAWIIVGTSVRDFLVGVASNCRSSIQAGLELDVVASNAVQLPGDWPTITLSCQDTSIWFQYLTTYVCSSLAKDGTDFRLVFQDGTNFPIIAAESSCQPNFQSKTVQLTLLNPLNQNGRYFLFSKVGSDGDVLKTKCGFGLNEFDSIIIRVDDCPPSSIGMESLTAKSLQIGLPEPNPTRDRLHIPILSVNSRDLHMQVRHVNGQLIHEQQHRLTDGVQRIELQTSHWPSGLYVVVLQTADGVVMRKVEVVR